MGIAHIEHMERGGREAMLFDLECLDISAINLRQAPATAALEEQKIYSMAPQQKWWFDKLMDGRLLATERSTVVNGWRPAPRGGFLAWSLNERDGTVVATGSGSGGVPTQFRTP